MVLRCILCETTFSKKANYDRHLQTNKHKKILSNNNLHKCTSCNKYYSSQKSLNAHMCVKLSNNTSINNSVQIEELQKTCQELKERLDKKDQEIHELQHKFEIFIKKCNNPSVMNFTVTTQGRRKINNTIRNEIVNKQNNKCNDCNNFLSQYYQIDHVIALQFGGSDETDNLQALCCECHAKKSIIENTAKHKIRNFIKSIVSKM